MEEKIQISQDELYQFLTDHNLIITRLGELIGLGIGSMSACFNHKLANGEPRYFTRQSVAKINEAMPQIAYEVERRRVVFNMANNKSKQRRVQFDPGCVEQMRALGTYFKVDAMVQRVLGWKAVKSRKVLFAPSSTMYGHVTPDDVRRVNEELMFVSFWLQRHEVVVHDSCSSSSSSEKEEPGASLSEEEIQQMYEEEMMLTDME